ncbi:hypothetical protein ACFY05_31935 [Microtetraspora fusca]|uniref:Lytic transglycosylase domain-containing protein n=1 Tax=Microtetraspora fusca TaxID=1997 RepID=A0ABW6VDU2_MICFU
MLKTKLAVAVAVPAAVLAATAASCEPAGPVKGICDYAPVAAPAKPKIGSPKKPLNTEQRTNATAVVNEAARRHLPERAAVIAIATTLRESWLHTGVVGDKGTAHGIFQQRGVSGWGPLSERLDPTISARKFYSHLVKQKDWQSLPLTVAAANVQRPRKDLRGAYAEFEGVAGDIVDWTAYHECQSIKGKPAA